jgi:hypothetical protein
VLIAAVASIADEQWGRDRRGIRNVTGEPGDLQEALRAAYEARTQLLDESKYQATT